jgi:FAD/FMN-containing dehydrogenase
VGHQDYDKYRRVWNGVVDRHPAAIVCPKSVDDVRRAVHAAAISGSLLAVRGGGHSFPGFSTCDQGLVLDLSEMKAISIDYEALTIDVEGGALLGDVDRATVPEGLVVPAGVVSHTGVAGLTLGGGMGWSSRKYGLTIDSLLGAEIVTAAGEVVWASVTSDPELFWGLRGGGGNFGVVTRFKFQMRPLGSIIVGQWKYAAADTRQALQTLRDRARAQPRDFTLNFTATTTGLSVTAVWSGDTSVAQAILSPFGALADRSVGRVEAVHYLSLQSRHDEEYAWSRRYYCKGGFWSDVTDEAIDSMIRSISDAPTPDSEISVLQLGGAVSDVSDEATAYTGRGAGYYWLAEPIWDASVDDDRCVVWGRGAGKSLSRFSIPGNYINEQADAGPGVALDAYGVEKYQRLAHLKARVDPHNLFRLNQNITPRHQ